MILVIVAGAILIVLDKLFSMSLLHPDPGWNQEIFTSEALASQNRSQTHTRMPSGKFVTEQNPGIFDIVTCIRVNVKNWNLMSPNAQKNHLIMRYYM
jgi:hypothetical protein